MQADLPGSGAVNIGVLLEDPSSDALHLRFRRDWETIAGEDDAEVLEILAGDLERKSAEMGAGALLRYLQDTLSNAIRVNDPEPVIVEGFVSALNRLYREHITSKVLEFRTHLPRFSLAAAAGKFLENAEVTEEGWIEAPEDLHLTPDMFVAHIAGHSMEPLIPDGSLCVFRSGLVGSRQGRLVLAEELRTVSGQSRYAVKRYSSEKTEDASGWRHTRIHLESLNSGYPSWDLEPDQDRFRIIAEFVRVVE